MESLPSLSEIFPTPLEWCKIPVGNIVIQDKTEHVPQFYMSKYPITHPQYAKFIEADGYNQQRWWTEIVWKARTEGWNMNSRDPSGITWAEPRNWNDTKAKNEAHPVVGVSWYEAMAFCNWLNAQANYSVKITLPTEYQWLQVMQNRDTDDGDTYGVISVLNTMWEWCLDPYEDDYTRQHPNPNAEWRVLGTASYGHLTTYASAAQRINLNPHMWFDYDFSIRLVCEDNE